MINYFYINYYSTIIKIHLWNLFYYLCSFLFNHNCIVYIINTNTNCIEKKNVFCQFILSLFKFL
jgi:hypothetical protein